ncbi:hypothetical protein QO010_002936 [Caulobacter ginsengisoli]|uniref:Permease n=1 Tax=Caulobacter ginsengisoli TaxID=400775 RepID=A0ABU0IW49_9CAUL|nr:hypothetical protein [Caulobacter ginsengisoli]MDQ0465152.1 hypothetical protein [Caulobacter ginsengisoli]
MTDRLADTLLRLAARIAPSERRPWIEAVRAEADLIGDRSEALRWAAGGLLAAMGWAARKDLVFLAALAFMGYCGLLWVQDIYLQAAVAKGAPFLDAAVASQIWCYLPISALFAAWRPDRAVVVGALMPLFAWIVFVRSLLMGIPSQWSFDLWCLYESTKYVFVGTALGAVVGWALRRAVPKRPTTD